MDTYLLYLFLNVIFILLINCPLLKGAQNASDTLPISNYSQAHHTTTWLPRIIRRDNGVQPVSPPRPPGGSNTTNSTLAPRTTRLKYPESLYAPYWEDGHAVFLRTTRKGRVYAQVDRNTTTTPETTTLSPTTTTTTPQPRLMAVNRDCYRECATKMYEYGLVCAMRLDMVAWKTEFKEFTSLCSLELENCETTKIRPAWHMIHTGECPELHEFEVFPTNDTLLAENAIRYMQIDLNLGKKPRYYEKTTASATTTPSPFAG